MNPVDLAKIHNKTKNYTFWTFNSTKNLLVFITHLYSNVGHSYDKLRTPNNHKTLDIEKTLNTKQRRIDPVDGAHVGEDGHHHNHREGHGLWMHG